MINAMHTIHILTCSISMKINGRKINYYYYYYYYYYYSPQNRLSPKIYQEQCPGNICTINYYVYKVGRRGKKSH